MYHRSDQFWSGLFNTKERRMEMTKKEEMRRNIAGSVLERAHNLWRSGIKYAVSWGNLLKLCWLIVKGGVNEEICYVKGVSFSNEDGTQRQRLIQGLTRASKGSYWIILTREKDNSFDENAVRVEAVKEGGVKATIGYLPRELAIKASPLMDSGKEALVTGFEFSNPRCGLAGMKISFVCK